MTDTAVSVLLTVLIIAGGLALALWHLARWNHHTPVTPTDRACSRLDEQLDTERDYLLWLARLPSTHEREIA